MPKSALQELEAKLVVLEMGAGLLQKSMAEARRADYRKNRNLGVARDTTPILGKGAVKDTYNLLGALVKKVVFSIVMRRPRSVPQTWH